MIALVRRWSVCGSAGQVCQSQSGLDYYVTCLTAAQKSAPLFSGMSDTQGEHPMDPKAFDPFVELNDNELDVVSAGGANQRDLVKKEAELHAAQAKFEQ